MEEYRLKTSQPLTVDVLRNGTGSAKPNEARNPSNSSAESGRSHARSWPFSPRFLLVRRSPRMGKTSFKPEERSTEGENQDSLFIAHHAHTKIASGHLQISRPSQLRSRFLNHLQPLNPRANSRYTAGRHSNNQLQGLGILQYSSQLISTPSPSWKDQNTASKSTSTAKRSEKRNYDKENKPVPPLDATPGVDKKFEASDSEERTNRKTQFISPKKPLRSSPPVVEKRLRRRLSKIRRHQLGKGDSASTGAGAVSHIRLVF